MGLPNRSAKLKTVISTGLEQTASLWNPIAVAYDWNTSGNHPDNEMGHDAQTVQHNLSRF